MLLSALKLSLQIEACYCDILKELKVCVCVFLYVSGGAAEQSGLQSGDELLQVHGVSLQDMTRFEAWNMIKALPEGPITAVIRRRQGGQNETAAELLN